MRRGGKNRWALGGLAALLLLAGAMPYVHTLDAPYVLDDWANVASNQTIRPEAPWWRLFAPPLNSSLAGRPVANISFAANFALGGLDMRGYRLANLLIHLLGGLVLFGLVRTLLSRPPVSPKLGNHRDSIAFFSALFWLLHPLQTSAVTYISQRCESLMALFFLLTVWCAAQGFASHRKNAWHAAAALFFVLGAGTKEVVVAAPFLILVMEWVFWGRTPKKALGRSPLLYAGLGAGLVFLVTLVATGRQAGTARADLTSWEYLARQPEAIFTYLRLFLWPRGLCFDYWKIPIRPVYTWGFGALLLAGVAASTVLVVKRRPLGFALSWFFLILAPTSSVLPLPDPVVEYRIYLPLASLAAMVSAGLFYRFGGRRGTRLLLAAFLVAMAAGLGWATSQRNTVFQDRKVLWSDTLDKRPENYRAMVNLGRVYQGEGDLETAESLYRRALDKDPGQAKGWSNLGRLFYDRGQYNQAIIHYQQALALNPKSGGFHSLMALAYSKLGQPELEMQYYQMAVQLDGELSYAWYNLGNLYLEQGNDQDAARCFKEAVTQDPGYIRAHANLGVALHRLGRLEEAIRHYRLALERDPGFTPAKNNLEEALKEKAAARDESGDEK